MNLTQRTLKEAVNISGTGLHTGAMVNMSIEPAETGHGIKFQRTDLEGQPVIPADADLVTTTERGTTLTKGEASVSTIEHLLAALRGLEIDNVLVKLDGPEIPIMDGSSIKLLEQIEAGGIEDQGEERDIFEVTHPIKYIDEAKGIELVAMPADDFKVTTLIDYGSTVLGQQYATLESIEDFRKEIAHARTFCFLHEVEALASANLIKGGTLDNAIVVVDKDINNGEVEKLTKLFNNVDTQIEVKKGILNNVELRYSNEPARHKLLDVIGDLALVGCPIKGHIIAKRPGHGANTAFAKKIKNIIRDSRKKVVAPYYDPNEPPIYDVPALMKILPHRYPFLLVDKIIKMTETEVVGVKSVTFNEPFFIGHFPGNPVMPGVLQIEALAQVGGILGMKHVDDPANYDTYFLKIDNAKFKYKVSPGDQLILKMEIISPIRRGIMEMRGTAFVGDNIATEADLMARIYRKEGV